MGKWVSTFTHVVAYRPYSIGMVGRQPYEWKMSMVPDLAFLSPTIIQRGIIKLVGSDAN